MSFSYDCITAPDVIDRKYIGSYLYFDYIKDIYDNDLLSRKSICEILISYLENEIKFIDKTLSENNDN